MASGNHWLKPLVPEAKASHVAFGEAKLKSTRFHQL
jgi:hypothetical protein